MLTRQFHDGAPGPILTGLDAPVSRRGHGPKMTIPGGYVVLNEQISAGHGKGTSVSVNMIHVYLSS